MDGILIWAVSFLHTPLPSSRGTTTSCAFLARGIWPKTGCAHLSSLRGLLRHLLRRTSVHAPADALQRGHGFDGGPLASRQGQAAQ
eukprot:3956958-Pyramimonas_sp.AAC.1